MKIKRPISVVPVLISILIFSYTSQIQAATDGDWQIWSTAAVQGKISPLWTVKLNEQFRIGTQASEIYYQHVQTDVIFQARPWLALNLTYRHIHMKVAGEWHQEKRPIIGATISWSRSIYRVDNSQKVERHLRDWTDNGWSYRNKLSLTLGSNWTRFNLEPYLADEIFVDLEEGDIYLNRVFAGTKLHLIKQFYADLFFLWQSSKAPISWTDFYILGGTLNLRF